MGERPLAPDFVIIGAQKAGSTALMRHLGSHPEVYMSTGETRYFRDPWFQMETPLVLGAAVAAAGPGVRRRGIKSPDLLGLTQSPQRVRDTLGLVDLIAVLRDPVARAVSAYHWAMQFGWLPIVAAEVGLRRLLDEHDPAQNTRASEVLEFGRYGAHLTRFLEVFPRENLHVMLQDDLRSDLARQSVELFEFLGVDSRCELPPSPGAVNESIYSLDRLRFIQHRNRHVVRPYAGYEGTYVQYAKGPRGRLVAGGVAAVDRLLLTKMFDNTKPQISDELRSRLIDFYRDDIATTATIIKRDLSAWTKSPSVTDSVKPKLNGKETLTLPVDNSSDQRRRQRAETRAHHFPETAIDSFSRIDSGMEFYLRISALLRPDMTAVDFGAGRGRWYADSDSNTRTKLRDMRGSVARVIGLDVDPVVAENPTLHESHVIKPDAPLPLGDESVDIIVSDFTFEHIDDPGHIGAEFDRVLRPGGWICARTPYKWGYIGVGGRLVPNRLHASWLTRLQPGRKEIDVFPVRYRLNTRKGLKRFFPPSGYEHIVYTMPGEPSYAGSSRLTWGLVGAAQRLQPRALEPMLLIFLHKRP